MSKREPLLSVQKLVDEFTEVHPLHAQLYAKLTACWVRDFYERLIDEGKLRVVEEVEAIEQPDTGYYREWACSKCGHDVENTSFCPGCGNKIKR